MREGAARTAIASSPGTRSARTRAPSIVHIAPGGGADDFRLGKTARPAGHRAARRVRPLPRRASGRSAAWTWRASRAEIIEALQARGFFYHLEPYTHRYPHCWRCGTALLFRVVDEWYISMGPVYDVPRAQVTAEQKAASLRYQIMDVVDQIRWYPGLRLRARARLAAHDVRLDRSRRSATGAWRCRSGSAAPARPSRSSAGARSCASAPRPRLRGSSRDGRSIGPGWTRSSWTAGPAAARCGASRDVGNPWLDAGIVPFSTLHYRTDPELLAEVVPGRLHHRVVPGPVPQLVLLDARDGHGPARASRPS